MFLNKTFSYYYCSKVGVILNILLTNCILMSTRLSSWCVSLPIIIVIVLPSEIQPHLHIVVYFHIAYDSHPVILHRATGSPEPIPRDSGHPGPWNVNPFITDRSQGTITHTHWRNLERPISLQRGVLRGNPQSSPHTQCVRWRESNPQSWRCESNVLTTKPHNSLHYSVV